jgi:hypothetical protein
MNSSRAKRADSSASDTSATAYHQPTALSEFDRVEEESESEYTASSSDDCAGEWTGLINRITEDARAVSNSAHTTNQI